MISFSSPAVVAAAILVSVAASAHAATVPNFTHVYIIVMENHEFSVWDEGTSNVGGGGQVAMLAVSPLAWPGFRSREVESHSVLGTWSARLIVPPAVYPLWSVSIPIVSPVVSFDEPVALPDVGTVYVVTSLAQSGAACGDWKSVRTSP